ncbi:MAG: AAA family ATPase [Paludibacteraceae bacterium]|jgi:AAA15 family ATPase/GTPase|nr:AAA family ATPase [Paludibacteraceae bacterium]
MIKEFHIKSFGPINDLKATNLSNINLIIGHNGSGKTYLLKSLFAATKTVERYQRGNDPKSYKELLSNNLWWTFQTRQLKNLVRKGDNKLEFSMKNEHKESFSFDFGTFTTKEVNSVQNNFSPTNTNSIFLPAKEVLSLQNIILSSREDNQMFGFDETYFDLAKALRPSIKGRNVKSFSKARKSLKDAIGGKIEFDDTKKVWVFRDNQNRAFDIDITSEGIKKISILDSLLGNHYLCKDSIVFIDELESNLHPKLIKQFLEIITILAKDGLQFFITTHNYFVIKGLYILAHKYDTSIPTISFDEDKISISDLMVEMPDNPIINESINLYKEEIAL